VLRNQQMKEAFVLNPNLPSIAKAFGIGTASARIALQEQGIVFPRTGRLLTSQCEKNKELVFQMIRDGASLSEVARRVGTNNKRVSKFLRRYGVDHNHLTGAVKEKHPNWKGGRLVDGNGYILVHCPNHPSGRKHIPYILEHRLVMEKMIGRFLEPGEVVHHKDGNKQNNDPSNLQLFSANSEHLRHELTGRCPKWTADGLERMKQGIARSAKIRRERRLKASTPDALQLL
jgi:hypothetical protein